MNIEEVSNLAENIDNKILKLIDIKIESDMEKVLNEIRIDKREVLTEIRSQNTEIKRLEDNFNTKFSMLMWAIGILMAVMIALKFFN